MDVAQDRPYSRTKLTKWEPFVRSQFGCFKRERAPYTCQSQVGASLRSCPRFLIEKGVTEINTHHASTIDQILAWLAFL
jgi:hypothetical protein